MAGRQPAWVRRTDAANKRTEVLAPRAVTPSRPRTTYGAPPPALAGAFDRIGRYAREAWDAVTFACVAAVAWLRAVVAITRLRAGRLALERELNRRIAALGRSALGGDADGVELARERALETAAAIAGRRASEAGARDEAHERIEHGRRRR